MNIYLIKYLEVLIRKKHKKVNKTLNIRLQNDFNEIVITQKLTIRGRLKTKTLSLDSIT